DATALARLLPPRAPDAHKGSHGHVLVVGGDHGYGGAISLAAQAALRGGAGLVSVATRAEHVAPILSRRPEAMVRAVDGARGIAPMLERASVVAVGPGLGQSDWGRELLEAVIARWRATLDEARLSALAAALALAAPRGFVLHLRGELGAGKTTFARAFVRALLPGTRVKSPSFALVEPYALPEGALYHIDL